jgi:hypothetical protein
MPQRHADSVFEGFDGRTAPILLSGESYGVFQDCVFRDMILSAEIFDVSFGGSLKVENCVFVRVSHAERGIVSTSLNDAFRCFNDKGFQYFLADDAAYDLESTPISSNDPSRGFRVRSGMLSDCLRFRSSSCSRMKNCNY